MAVIFDTNILMGTENFNKMIDTFRGNKKILALESLRELDGLKNAEGRRGYQARRAIRKIKENIDSFEIVYIGEEYEEAMALRVDDKISLYAEVEKVKIVTNDIAMELVAKGRGVETQNYYEKVDVGNGYLEFDLGIEGNRVMAAGQALQINKDKLKDGEFLILKEFGIPVSTFFKDGERGFIKIAREDFLLKPGHKQKVSPKDQFQACAMYSLKHQDFTIITGRAGSGKTYLAVSRMLEALENGEVTQIVIFTNPTKAKGAEQLGFYSGDREGKLLQNSIGGILASKLGGMMQLEKMLFEEKIVIVPMSDIRGIEVGPNAFLYITEAQNADAELMQLAIQRGAGCLMIIEGDPYTQLDHWSYGGEGNGMLKAISIFRGFEGFSHIHLPIIYRSAFAAKAAEMTEVAEYLKEGDEVVIVEE